MFLIWVSYKSFLFDLFVYFSFSIFSNILSCILASFGLYFIWKKKFPNKANNFWGFYFIFLGGSHWINEMDYQKKFIEITWTDLWIILTLFTYAFFRSILIMGGIKILFEEFNVTFSWKKVWGIFFLLLGVGSLLKSLL